MQNLTSLVDGTPADVAVVWMLVMSTYATILGTIWSCGKFVKARLHDFTTECALERARQNEMMERLMMMRADYIEDPEDDDVGYPCDS